MRSRKPLIKFLLFHVGYMGFTAACFYGYNSPTKAQTLLGAVTFFLMMILLHFGFSLISFLYGIRFAYRYRKNGISLLLYALLAFVIAVIAFSILLHPFPTYHGQPQHMNTIFSLSLRLAIAFLAGGFAMYVGRLIRISLNRKAPE